MIKEWATVVSWQNGQALVSCDVKASCSSCASRAGCGSRVLNKLGPQTTHTIVVPCDEPLVPGQKVELGIAEGSLLSSALLVYMSPLVGLFLIASLFQLLFASDVAALCGAILGGIGGFLIARGYSRKFAARAEWQPIILSVALPPGLVLCCILHNKCEDVSRYHNPYGMNISSPQCCSVECGVSINTDVKLRTATSKSLVNRALRHNNHTL